MKTMASPTDQNRSSLLLTTLSKSLSDTRSRISTSAPATVREAYSDVASFFSSDEDDSGVNTLVSLLLSKIDKINECTEASLDDLLKQHEIYSLLQRVEDSINHVDAQQKEFEEKDEADRASTLAAISSAKTQQVTTSSVDEKEKKKRIYPGEYIGYHAYKLKEGHKMTLMKELEEMEKENDEMEKRLEQMWKGWNESVKELEGVVGKMGEMSAER